MTRPSLVVVLAEDERQQRLARRYLYRLQYGHHDIRLVDLPSGRGSGVEWVLQRYAAEVQKFRSRAAKAGTALIVVIDADTFHIDQRDRQLRQALADATFEIRRDHEAIIHLIPKRNVETWILCLTGKQVDETTDYSRERDVDRLIPTAAETLFDWSRRNATLPAHCVPSLEVAVPELRRLE